MKKMILKLIMRIFIVSAKVLDKNQKYIFNILVYDVLSMKE